MRELTIHRLYFTQADCYNKGVYGPPHGIQVHSTGANNPYLHRYVGPDDGLLGPNKYDNTHNRPGGNVCANAYVGKLQDGTVTVYQALPWDMHCWLSGSGDSGKKSANAQGFIGFEVCEDSRSNRSYFEDAVMDKSVNLCAYLCWKYSIPLTAVRDHSELHKMGMATDHGDITWWLKNFGLNMDKYREAVQKAMNEGVRVKYIEDGNVWYDGPDGETEPEKQEGTAMDRKMRVIGDGYLNLRAAPDKSAESIGKLYPGDIVTEKAEYPDGWAYVQADGKQGYCVTQFLEPVPDEQEKPSPDQGNNSPEQPEIDQELAGMLAEARIRCDELSALIDAISIKLTGAVG